MRLIVGLGNPGERYARTRHNIGAMALERAAAKWAVALPPVGPGRWGLGRVGDSEVALAVPLAWMNQSGPAVKAMLDALTLSPEQLVLVHDDLDLEVGRLRVKRGGGWGGHNGVSSVIETLETQDFCRVKVGIGRPPPGVDPADYVLSPFSPDERELIEATLDRAVPALECLVTEGLEAAMNRYNVRPARQEPDENEK